MLYVVELVLRMFHGRIAKLHERFLPTLNFVHPNITLNVILDNETKKDHDFGVCLNKNAINFSHKINTHYSSASNLEWGLFRKAYGRHGTPIPGYDRQNYDTFFFDKYSSADIIGIVDADSCFTSYMPYNYPLKDGRVVIHATRYDHWSGDTMALNFSPFYDVMWTDTFPQFFWRNTFTKFRSSHNFLKKYKHFSRHPYSPVNILANWALKNQPKKYHLVLHPDTHGKHISDPMLIGAHKNHGWCNDPKVYDTMCCILLNNNCTDNYIFTKEHISKLHQTELLINDNLRDFCHHTNDYVFLKKFKTPCLL